MAMQTTRTPSAVHGILEQFRELGEVLAVALVDRSGRAVASAGDESATGALATAVARLLRGMPGDDAGSAMQRLFEESDEFNVPRSGASSVALLLRRVGEDWALAAIWSSDTPLGRLRSFARETASRLESVS